MALSGMLLAEPARGYPPGTPLGGPVHLSFIGALHDWAAGIAMGSVVAAMLVIGRRFVREIGGGG